MLSYDNIQAFLSFVVFKLQNNFNYVITKVFGFKMGGFGEFRYTKENDYIISPVFLNKHIFYQNIQSDLLIL